MDANVQMKSDSKIYVYSNWSSHKTFGHEKFVTDT